MWQADVLQVLSVFSSLFVSLLMRERESEECRVSYLFWERCQDAREEHHATGNTANLRENILGEVSVNTSVHFEFYENISQTVDARLEDDPFWLRLLPWSAQSCCPCRLLHYCCIPAVRHVHAGVDANLLVIWGPHKNIQKQMFLFTWLSWILVYYWLFHIYAHVLGYSGVWLVASTCSYWTLTWSCMGLFSAGCRDCFVADVTVQFVMSLCVCAEDRPSAPGSVLLRWRRAESGGHWAGQPRRQEGPSEMHAAGQPVPLLSGEYGKNRPNRIVFLCVSLHWNYSFVQLDHRWCFFHLLLIMDENSLWMESGSPLLYCPWRDHFLMCSQLKWLRVKSRPFLSGIWRYLRLANPLILI